MKKGLNTFLSLSVLVFISGVLVPTAVANESPNWIATKVNSFTLESSSSLTTRGLVTIRGVVPARSPEYDQAIEKQQLNGGTGIGFCRWTLKDASYPGYADVGGVGILVTGPSLPPDKINSDSFSIKGIRYTSFLSQGATEYKPMDIWSKLGEKDAVNLNGSDLLFESKRFSNGMDVNFNFKEVTASFSTDGWPEGNYQISVVWNDGCSDVFTSVPVTISLNAIPSPNWKCDSPTSLRADEPLKVTCNSSVPVSLLPYHLEIFQGGKWVEVSHGTANGNSVTIQNLQLPIGNNSLRFRTDELVNQFHDAVAPEFSIQVLPAPYTVRCSAPSAVTVGDFLDVACLATSNIDGAIGHLQSLSNNNWVNIGDGQWKGTNMNFSNLSFSKAGSGTLRVVTDAQSGKYLSSISASLEIKISAAYTPTFTGGGSGSVFKVPSGKVDKTSNAYKTMVNVGKNFAKVSLASDTALSQCTSAAKAGIIRANGHPQYLGVQARVIQSYLNTASGFRGCLDGFGH